ncbi:MAG: DUF429 domain-containing protein [Oceanicaulis sp.]
MAIGFGLDIAGYSGGKSSLAMVNIESAQATILKDHSFLRKVKGEATASVPLGADVETLTRCLKIGPVAIDVPIDLQGLPVTPTSRFVWGMTARPVDRFFGGLAPLADKIGAPVARIANTLRAGNLSSRVGEDLLETYPAACLQLLSLEYSGYKGTSASWAEGTWFSSKPVSAKLLNDLRIVAEGPIELTDDDIDAILCAIVAAAPDASKLYGSELADRIASGLCLPHGEAPEPAGYQLLKTLPYERLYVRARPYDEVI